MFSLRPIAALLVAAAGCSPCDAAGPPAIVLGTASRPFSELPPTGATVRAEWGPQGGQHVTLALWAQGFAARDLYRVNLEGRVDGALVATDSGSSWFMCDNNERRIVTRYALFLPFHWEVDVDALDGQTLHIAASLSDPDGPEAATEVDVVVRAR